MIKAQIVASVYCIINKVNDKLYIGSTIDTYKRKREHLHYLRNNKHHSIYLQNSYNKYGESNFDFIIIEKCKVEELLEAEQFYIDLFNPEYNICKIAGSSLGIKRTEEQKINISKAHIGQKAWNKGIPKTIEEIELHRLKILGKPSKKKGIKLSDEVRQKMSKSRIGKLANNRIKVYQYDKLTRKFITEFESLTDAQIKTNTKGIHFVLTGKYKHANNYLWSKQKLEYLPL